MSENSRATMFLVIPAITTVTANIIVFIPEVELGTGSIGTAFAIDIDNEQSSLYT